MARSIFVLLWLFAAGTNSQAPPTDSGQDFAERIGRNAAKGVIQELMEQKKGPESGCDKKPPDSGAASSDVSNPNNPNSPLNPNNPNSPLNPANPNSPLNQNSNQNTRPQQGNCPPPNQAPPSQPPTGPSPGQYNCQPNNGMGSNNGMWPSNGMWPNNQFNSPWNSFDNFWNEDAFGPWSYGSGIFGSGNGFGPGYGSGCQHSCCQNNGQNSGQNTGQGNGGLFQGGMDFVPQLLGQVTSGVGVGQLGQLGGQNIHLIGPSYGSQSSSAVGEGSGQTKPKSCHK